MNRTDWLSLVVSGLFLTVNANSSQAASLETNVLPEVELERLASLPEEQIDVGQVALILATEVFPGLDVKNYSAQLNGLVKGIRALTKGSTDPDYRVRAMNTYLYKRQGFHYDFEDMLGEQLKNRYLNGILDTKSGSCTTMPLLYLALAQRLGYPIYPVAAPQHLFCCYRLPDGTHHNIEATAGGWSSDEDYIRELEIPAQGLKSGAYLETMTYRQLLGDLIIENGSLWARQGDFLRAVRYFTVGLQLNPKAAEVYPMLGAAYRQLAKEYHRMALQLPSINQPALELTRQVYLDNSRRYAEQVEQAFQQAEQLGAAQPIQANYWVRQKELREAARTTSQKGNAP